MGSCLSCFITKRINPKSSTRKKSSVINEDDNENYHLTSTNMEVYNRFHVFSKIGSSKVGKTYLAIDEKGNRIALKAFNKIKIPTEVVLNSVLDTNANLRNLKHENLMKLYQIIQTESDIFLVLEYAEKGNLEKMFERYNNFPLFFLKILSAQIINVLFFLHSHGINYGDLNLKDVFINFRGFVKLSEINNVMSMSLLDKNIEGTLNFIAPEILQGVEPNLSTDFYSLGVILYFLYYRRYPLYVKKKLVNFCKESDNKTERDFGNLVERLLEEQQINRIGKKIKEFQTHPFFEGVNWKSPQKDEAYSFWLTDVVQTTFEETNSNNRVNFNIDFDGNVLSEIQSKLKHIKPNFHKNQISEFETLSQSQSCEKYKESSGTKSKSKHFWSDSF